MNSNVIECSKRKRLVTQHKGPIEICTYTMYCDGNNGGDLLKCWDHEQFTAYIPESRVSEKEDAKQTLATVLLDVSAKKEEGMRVALDVLELFEKNRKQDFIEKGYISAEALFGKNIDDCFPEGVFSTAIYAEVRTNGQLKYINAGNPAGLLINDSGVQELKLPNDKIRTTLGFAKYFGKNYIQENQHIHAQHMQPGETVLFFSDGLVDHAREKSPRGIEAIVETIQNFYHSPGLLAEQLQDNLEERGQFTDDVSYTIIRHHT